MHHNLRAICPGQTILLHASSLQNHGNGQLDFPGSLLLMLLPSEQLVVLILLEFYSKRVELVSNIPVHHRDLLLPLWLFIVVFWRRGFIDSQVGLRFVKWPSMTLNFWFELLILLLSPPVCWDCRLAPPCLVYVGLEIKSRASCIPGKRFTSWAISPAPILFLYAWETAQHPYLSNKLRNHINHCRSPTIK